MRRKRPVHWIYYFGRIFNYMERTHVSNWTGSATTAELVRKQIIDRYGQDEANNYDPTRNCLTFNQWLKEGYKVIKGEKAIKSFIVIEQKDDKGVVVRKFPKTVSLFYIRQVEKIG